MSFKESFPVGGSRGSLWNMRGLIGRLRQGESLPQLPEDMVIFRQIRDDDGKEIYVELKIEDMPYTEMGFVKSSIESLRDRQSQKGDTDTMDVYSYLGRLPEAGGLIGTVSYTVAFRETYSKLIDQSSDKL